MKAIVQFSKQITLEIEERDERLMLHKAIALTNPRTFCNVCKATEGFKLGSHKSGEYVFTYVECKCGAKSNLGEYKSGGYFWKEFEKYVPKDQD